MASPVAELSSEGLGVAQPKTLNGTRVSVTSSTGRWCLFAFTCEITFPKQSEFVMLYFSPLQRTLGRTQDHSSKLGSVIDQGMSLNLSFLINTTETCFFRWGIISTKSHRKKNALNV